MSGAPAKRAMPHDGVQPGQVILRPRELWQERECWMRSIFVIPRGERVI